MEPNKLKRPKKNMAYKIVGRKQIKGKERRKSEIIRSAYKSPKHQQSRQKRGNKNKAALIMAYTKMSMSHHVLCLLLHHTKDYSKLSIDSPQA